MQKPVVKLPQTNNGMLKFVMLLSLGLVFTLLIYPFWNKYLYMAHSILEALCISIAFSTFIVAWVTFERNSYKNRIIGFSYLIVAVFDLLHTFYYQTNLFEYYYNRDHFKVLVTWQTN